MQLNKDIENFYLSILGYAGLQYENNIITNVNESLGGFKIDDKFVTLPYLDNLKNPDGKHIFHLLNENYTSPETTLFNLYKKKLTFELNLRLSTLMISLLNVGSDVLMQQRIKSSKLIELISNMGEVDKTSIDNLVNVIKHSQKVNNEAYIFDIYLKKNGEINDTPYSAIGKINFHLYNALNKALEDKEEGNKVYGCKIRKKDLIAFTNLLQLLFPDIDSPDTFSIGTDHKVFRYLNALLVTSYQISSRVNDITEMLEEVKEPSLALSECISDVNWSNMLENMYNLTDEIRIIPNQTNISTEAHNKLNLKEPKQSITEPVKELVSQPPSFQPQTTQPVQQPVMIPQLQQVPQQQRQLTPEEIINGGLTMQRPMGYPQQGYPIQPMMQQPMQQMQPMMAPMAQQMPQQPMMYPNQMPVMVNPNMQMQQPMQQPNPTMSNGWVPFQPSQQPMMQQQQPMMYPAQMYQRNTAPY